MRPELRLAAAALLLAALAPSVGRAASVEGHSWKLYGNSRFGYSICYPADLLHPEPEPDAHDGVIFDGPPGVSLSVSGERASAAHMQEVLDLVVKTMDGHVSYHAAGLSWRVASGTAHGKTFYSRVVAGEGVVAQYILTYPPGRSGDYAPLIKRMSGCLKIG